MTAEQGPSRPPPNPSPAGDVPDALLAARAREGDEEAFAALVRRHGPELLRLAEGLLPERADARDTVRDAFVSAWRRLPAVRPGTSFTVWTRRLVTDRCLARSGTRHAVAGRAGAAPATGTVPAEGGAPLTAAVMEVVRRAPRPGRPLPLGRTGGDGPVTEAAGTRALRAAADRLPGVRAGSCRVFLSAPGTAGAAGPAEAAGGPGERPAFVVRIEVAADWSWEVPRLAALVRQHVTAAARSAFDAEPVAVDVAVVDLLGPAPR